MRLNISGAHLRRTRWSVTAALFAFVALIAPRAGAQIPTGYYDGVDTSNPAALRASLHATIDDHIRYPYTSTSTDTWDILELADEDPNNAGNILDVYKNASYPKQGGGNTLYNREHTWPKSYGFPNDGATNYPYTDCHMLYLVDDGYNSSRSNKPYRYCDAGCSENPTDFNDGMGGGSGTYPADSNWTSGSFDSGTWETWIGRRGDVARALLYMDVRYEGGTHGVTGVAEPDLVLTDDEALIAASNTGANEGVAYMGMLSVLLQWNLEDPVDAREQHKNDVVYNFQGNRNPFVDHPEWVACVFGGSCGGGDVTPPQFPTGLVATGGNGQVDLDWDDNLEPDLGGYRVYRSTDGVSFAPIATTSAANSGHVDASVAGGTTYHYYVTALDTSGNESTPSLTATATPQGGGGGSGAPWINEFHYDNDGADTGERFEIAGPAGTDLSGWSVVGYNGSNQLAYQTVALAGVLADQSGGFGTRSFAFSGMQNGSPDGLALIDGFGAVVEFLSYEGSFAALDGPAAGLTSVDIGVQEETTTPIGQSLQRVGTGSAAADFTWQPPATASFDAPNAGQSFVGGADVTPPQFPTGLIANGGDGQVVLNWDDNLESDLDGYLVYRSADGVNFSAVTPSPIATSDHADSTVTNGTTYHYKVTAVDTSGNESAASLAVTATPQGGGGGGGGTAWINEFHYDNDGADTGERFEIAGPAGTDLSGWSVVGYNGSNQLAYQTIVLSGVIANQTSGFGALAFDFTGMQNGSPDGLALIDGFGAVVEFLSYEGSFTALDGPAAGITSVDIGVQEETTTPVGQSLQRVGDGAEANAFTWQAPAAASFGAPNVGQSFGGGAGGPSTWYYFSFSSSTEVPGVGTVADEDVVRYDPSADAWELYFDGSDVGVTGDVDALHVRADGSLILSFDAALSISGLVGGPSGGSVDDSDLVVFQFTSSGADTAGSFTFLLDGSDVGLSTNGEDVDGVHEFADGTLAISTSGSVSANGASGNDEDVLLLAPTSLGAGSGGSFSLLFDGSDAGFNDSSSEDLNAVAFDGADLLFSCVGAWAAAGTGGADDDVGSFTGSFGSSTTGDAVVIFALTAAGIPSSANIDGLSRTP